MGTKKNPIKSMTGYCSKEYVSSLGILAIELRAVNNRYADFHFKLPRQLYPYEHTLRKYLGTILKRGHIHLQIKIKTPAENTYTMTPNIPLAKAYAEACATIEKSLLPDVSLPASTLLLRYADHLLQKNSAQPLDQSAWEELFGLIQTLLSEFDAMRVTEGTFLLEALKKNLENIGRMVLDIEECTQELTLAYKDKLRERLQAFSMDTPLNEDRLASEAAYYAERSDITEEIVRLKSHLALFSQTLSQGAPIGKKLDFILQEMNREINTVASKTNTFSVSETVIHIKSDIEKIREQVQNIE